MSRSFAGAIVSRYESLPWITQPAGISLTVYPGGCGPGYATSRTVLGVTTAWPAAGGRAAGPWTTTGTTAIATAAQAAVIPAARSVRRRRSRLLPRARSGSGSAVAPVGGS